MSLALGADHDNLTLAGGHAAGGAAALAGNVLKGIAIGKLLVHVTGSEPPPEGAPLITLLTALNDVSGKGAEQNNHHQYSQNSVHHIVARAEATLLRHKEHTANKNQQIDPNQGTVQTVDAVAAVHKSLELSLNTLHNTIFSFWGHPNIIILILLAFSHLDNSFLPNLQIGYLFALRSVLHFTLVK